MHNLFWGRHNSCWYLFLAWGLFLLQKTSLNYQLFSSIWSELWTIFQSFFTLFLFFCRHLVGMHANCLRYTKFIASLLGSKTCRILGIADDFKIIAKSSASWDKWISHGPIILKSSASWDKWISQGPIILKSSASYNKWISQGPFTCLEIEEREKLQAKIFNRKWTWCQCSVFTIPSCLAS